MKKTTLKTFLLCLVFILFFALGTNFSFAKIYSDDITATISPKNPGPNDLVSVSIQAYSTNLDEDTISWIIAGKTIKKGVGEKATATDEKPAEETKQ